MNVLTTQREEVEQLTAEIAERSSTFNAKRTKNEDATKRVADIYLHNHIALTFGYA